MPEESSKISAEIGHDKTMGSSLLTSFFQLLYLVIKDNNLATIPYVFLLLVQTLQVHYFKFHALVSPSPPIPRCAPAGSPTSPTS